jgi:uncharacterized protein YyaL (SSP411 family)
MANALAAESSPYLRQHAHNPVDWMPWGPSALAAARERDVPLLVSIGYSACHWCHVMERESFEDEHTARTMNENFVCVKVDREERPDVDALYMEAVQGMTGHGGWPLNVFLTPEGLPFYGGTYFPPQERPGMASFAQVLLAVSEAWEERGAQIRASSEQLRERLSAGALLRASKEPLQQSMLEDAVERLRATYDPVNGGFGGAPKFPQASVLEFLMARGEREMSLYTLRSMAGGGIHDQVGGGFHRYAVDQSWTVPHFEKMLYDNALLARAYLQGFKLSGDERLLDVCHDTLDWALREMRSPEGGFYSALDADSDGAEGRFYVWRTAELERALGQDADAAIRWFGATEQGNFTDGAGGDRIIAPGLNVLEDRGPRPEQPTRERIRARLLEAREERTRPGLDDKRLAGWNALMIAALAEAGGRFAEPAITCAEFVLRDLRDERGGLLRSYNDGQAKIGAYLEDYAFLLEALIALFEASCDERWLTESTTLADQLIERFSDPEHGGFFSTAADGEQLIARRKELEDSPIPAGGSSAAMGLLRLAQLTGEERYERHSASAIALLQTIAPRHPTAFGHMLQAMHWRLAQPRPIACAVPGPAPLSP